MSKETLPAVLAPIFGRNTDGTDAGVSSSALVSDSLLLSGLVLLGVLLIGRPGCGPPV